MNKWGGNEEVLHSGEGGPPSRQPTRRWRYGLVLSSIRGAEGLFLRFDFGFEGANVRHGDGAAFHADDSGGLEAAEISRH